MYKLSIFLLIGVMSMVAQTSNKNFNRNATVGSDSLADVFPLSIGNQWTYDYFWNYEDYNDRSPMFRSCDSGAATVRVIGSTPNVDSTIWLLEETKSLYSIYNNYKSSIPSISIDTFEVIELLQGRHRLYRIDDRIYHSVFPLSRSFPDTALFYRFGMVNSDGIIINETIEWPGFYRFTLKQGVGQIFFSGTDGCTCMEWYEIHHSLRNYILTGIKNHYADNQQCTFHLKQNYPNPFNPSTEISFALPSNGFVTLKVYDLLGKEVATLVAGVTSAGNHSVRWDASSFASGIYFYRLQAGQFTETKKLIILK